MSTSPNSAVAKIAADQLARAWVRYKEAVEAQDPDADIVEESWGAMDEMAQAVHAVGQQGLLGPAMERSIEVFDDLDLGDTWHDFKHITAMYAGQQEADGVEEDSGEGVAVVTRIFGIPVAGATHDAMACAQPPMGEELIKLLLSSGALPAQGTVTLLGVVPATTACERGMDAEWMWQASSAAMHAQSDADAAGEIMKGVLRAQAAPDDRTVKVGGYVILGMHTSVLHEDEELAELGDAEDGRGEAWDEGLQVLLEERGSMAFGYPDVVLDAGVQALAWQLHRTFLMCKAAESADGLQEGTGEIVGMAFHPREGQETWPIVATFADGQEIELNLFPAGGGELMLPVMEALEDGLGIETDVVMDDPIKAVSHAATARRILH